MKMAECRKNAAVRDAQIALNLLAAQAGAGIEQASIRPRGVPNIKSEQLFRNHAKSI